VSIPIGKKRNSREPSGGAQTRDAFVEALVFDPDLLLDNKDMSAEAREARRQSKTTTGFVARDQAQAPKVIQRITILDRGLIAQYTQKVLPSGDVRSKKERL
jgi:ABC-type Fe3+/spermidine/putrescine transport system ATPase subunit